MSLISQVDDQTVIQKQGRDAITAKQQTVAAQGAVKGVLPYDAAGSRLQAVNPAGNAYGID